MNMSPPVVHGDYEELRFLFADSALPAEQTSPGWLDGLVDAVVKKIRTNYLQDLPTTIVEVEASGYLRNASELTRPAVLKGHQPGTRHSVLKRQSDRFFYADINLLPEALLEEHLIAINNVRSKLRGVVS